MGTDEEDEVDIGLASGRRHALEIRWNLRIAEFEVRVDGQVALQGFLNQGERPDVSYLRIRSLAETVDPNGLFIASVEMKQ